MANPLVCAVALRSLKLFDEEGTLEKVAHIEARHREFLETLKAHPAVFKPRAKGVVLAFDLEPEPAPYASEKGMIMRNWFQSQRMNIRPIGGSVYLMPPYCVTDEQLNRAYDGIAEGLSNYGQ
jgi:adenosylmethionine-8-amino-7-oxononanoate aminotransferase